MLDDIVFKGRYRNFTLRPIDLANIAFYFGIWLIVFLAFPNSLHDMRTRGPLLVIGAFGIWRYSWWMLNLVRSQYYGRVVYPEMRRYADWVWNNGQRPKRLHFVMTTYYEHPQTTRKCLEAIVKELRDIKIPTTLWVGTGADYDESVIEDWMACVPDMPLEVILIRQNQPGKRIAIGVALRALSRHHVSGDDIVLMLDGDSIIMHGCLQKCLSLFAAIPQLRALTTDEGAVCDGPVWVQKWLTMRFAQRRMWMQSHALSHRVLTLTGRFSVFRARDVVEEDFIRLVESDHLNHWFWGDFRFLSGDDKSTWFCLLRKRAMMLYVPDAQVWTIERIEGNGIKRARDNVLRWSGNMLRNGARAIALGPRIVPPYIWWCLIDQRMVIVTTILGFLTAVSVILFINPRFIFTYILWVMLTRFLMSSLMFLYTSRIHISFPFVLYCNQLILAFSKAYLIFRLPMQRWANRLDQKSGTELINQRENRLFPLYQNLFYVVLLALVLLLFTGVLRWPDIHQIL